MTVDSFGLGTRVDRIPRITIHTMIHRIILAAMRADHTTAVSMGVVTVAMAAASMAAADIIDSFRVRPGDKSELEIFRGHDSYGDDPRTWIVLGRFAERLWPMPNPGSGVVVIYSRSPTGHDRGLCADTDKLWPWSRTDCGHGLIWDTDADWTRPRTIVYLANPSPGHDAHVARTLRDFFVTFM